jgi:hypothetical protein
MLGASLGANRPCASGAVLTEAYCRQQRASARLLSKLFNAPLALLISHAIILFGVLRIPSHYCRAEQHEVLSVLALTPRSGEKKQSNHF